MKFKFRLQVELLAFLVTVLVALRLQAQQAASSIPSTQLVPGFESADIGGRVLRYMCKGSGTPTVLIEQGAGTSVETVFSWKKPGGWAGIVQQIEKVTRVCVYDRAGLGHSSKLTSARTSLDVAHDLHVLLDKLGISPPYVFVGQSIGGINARAFAKEYPNTVVGMILVDSARPDQQQRFAQVLPPRSPDESAILQGFRDGPDQTMQDGEWYDFKANTDVMRSTDSLGTMPLIVLTRSPKWQGPSLLPKEWNLLIEPVWQEMQTEFTKLSTNSKHIIAKKAGHNIQAEEPKLVTDAILDVINQVRNK